MKDTKLKAPKNLNLLTRFKIAHQLNKKRRKEEREMMDIHLSELKDISPSGTLFIQVPIIHAKIPDQLLHWIALLCSIDNKGFCNPTNEWLAEKCDTSIPHIEQTLNNLEKQGKIIRETVNIGFARKARIIRMSTFILAHYHFNLEKDKPTNE